MLSEVATAARMIQSLAPTATMASRPTSIAMAEAELQAARGDAVIYPLVAGLAGIVVGSLLVVAATK